MFPKYSIVENMEAGKREKVLFSPILGEVLLSSCFDGTEALSRTTKVSIPNRHLCKTQTTLLFIKRIRGEKRTFAEVSHKGSKATLACSLNDSDTS